MKMKKPGARIIKSVIAVYLCFVVGTLFREDGIVFYSQLASLWCMQPLKKDTKEKAIQRTNGTIVGAIAGLIVLLLDINCISKCNPDVSGYLYMLLVSFMVGIVIYITVLLKIKNASYFSCVVLLSIVVNHIGDGNPYLFVWNRFLDTMLGIVIGMLVNNFRLPYKKNQDTLFVSGIDDTLLSHNHAMSNFSKVELNRMIDDGVKFTLATKRTPAKVMELMPGIAFNLPIVVMDGAALYDLTTNKYLKTYILSQHLTKQIRDRLDDMDINYFMNLLIDDTLMIQYNKLENDAEQDIYAKLHESPFRNYTTVDVQPTAQCIYFMMVAKAEQITEIANAFSDLVKDKTIRIDIDEAQEYAGYRYLKIYNPNASRRNMLEYLKEMVGAKNIVTFGSIEGKYDVVIHEYDSDKVVRVLRKLYEPLFFSKQG